MGHISTQHHAQNGSPKSHAYVITVFLQAFLVLGLVEMVAAGTTVSYLPGFDGELPFMLETGYIGVGESNESQLFYLFVQSQRSPAMDPLMLWLTGGPGCSVLSAFFYEHGPVMFDYDGYNGSLPTLHLNPYTWTKGINILYVDQPVGAGFSYSTTQENYYLNDTKSAAQSYEFLKKWLLEHPQYMTNQLFVGGDSYSGITLPIVVKHIVDGNNAGSMPIMNLKGYVLGNPKTDNFYDENSKFIFAFRTTLISQELYEAGKESCGGNYVDVNASNVGCVTALDEYEELVSQINTMNILEPNCQVAIPARRELEEDTQHIIASKLNGAYWCRDYNYVLASVWANDESVRSALNVRENTTGTWQRCNSSLAYTKTVSSSVPYHHYLMGSSLHILVYSGDHDFSVPHVGTQDWIHSLNLSTSESWRPWFINGQVAGYTEKLISDQANLVFATVKAAGHVAPEYKPEECYSMVDRFLAYYPL